jgi:hypothetical protein
MIDDYISDGSEADSVSPGVGDILDRLEELSIPPDAAWMGYHK